MWILQHNTGDFAGLLLDGTSHFTKLQEHFSKAFLILKTVLHENAYANFHYKKKNLDTIIFFSVLRYSVQIILGEKYINVLPSN